MSETHIQELARQIRETEIPDKTRYQRVNFLIGQITGTLAEPRNAKALRGAYMDLQLAVLHSSDPAIVDQYKQQCVLVLSRISRAARAPGVASLRSGPRVRSRRSRPSSDSRETFV